MYRIEVRGKEFSVTAAELRRIMAKRAVAFILTALLAGCGSGGTEPAPRVFSNYSTYIIGYYGPALPRIEKAAVFAGVTTATKEAGIER
jgi:hypothetical protein